MKYLSNKNYNIWTILAEIWDLLKLLVWKNKNVFHVSFYFSCPVFLDILILHFQNDTYYLIWKLRFGRWIHDFFDFMKRRDMKNKRGTNSIFLFQFSGNVGRNIFLTSTASQKLFQPYFQKSRLECYFLCLF